MKGEWRFPISKEEVAVTKNSMDIFDYMLGVEQGKRSTPQPSGTINITFMNGETEYAKIGVSSSDISINAPTTNPPVPEGKNVFKGWGIDGSNVPETFPKSFNEDTALNALFAKSYVDDLYLHFGLSKSQYPYVFFEGRNSGYCYVRFCSTYTNTNKKITTNAYNERYSDAFNSTATVDWTDLNTVYNWIVGHMTGTKSSSSKFDYGNDSNIYLFGNVSSAIIDVGASSYQEL